MPITPNLRHCNFKLAREVEKDKEKDEDFEKVKLFFMMKSSSLVLKEMSFQLLLEDRQNPKRYLVASSKQWSMLC